LGGFAINGDGGINPGAWWGGEALVAQYSF
jgi:hypothetical protein